MSESAPDGRMKLRLDELEVDSFDTMPETPPIDNGTVHGFDTQTNCETNNVCTNCTCNTPCVTCEPSDVCITCCGCDTEPNSGACGTFGTCAAGCASTPGHTC